MNRVNWDGSPLESTSESLPPNLRETIFEYLPPPVSITPIIEDLAYRYRNNQITGKDYAAMQAAAFILPKSSEYHEKRRQTFHQRATEAETDGYRIPAVFRELIESDAYVDRLHHNCIWLQMPDELWRLPADPSRLVFLAFVEGQGCCNWHLLLNPDRSHTMVACEHAFGMRSWWLSSEPDYQNWKVDLCADSIEEWLYHFFRDSAEHDRQYIQRLRLYHANGWNG